jgi:hypothetical protein
MTCIANFKTARRQIRALTVLSLKPNGNVTYGVPLPSLYSATPGSDHRRLYRYLLQIVWTDAQAELVVVSAMLVDNGAKGACLT